MAGLRQFTNGSKLFRMKAIQRAIVFVFVATSCFAQDTARMEEVVQTYVQNKTFMGAVLVARGLRQGPINTLAPRK
jgi:hypothetical protein